MKKTTLSVLLLLSMFIHGCIFYEMGRMMGKAIAFPVEATLGITAGTLDGFFGTNFGKDTDKSDTSTPKREISPRPKHEEKKNYRRDNDGNIIW